MKTPTSTTLTSTASLDRRRMLALGACAAAAPWSAARAAASLQATLAYGSSGYTWAAPYVAEEGGYWKAENVDLKTSVFESGREALQALLTGSADFSASTDTPFVIAALNGLKPVAIANYSRYSRDMRIAVRVDGQIDPNVPASLKGRKIATRVGTSGQYLLAKSLQLVGLTPQDVTVVDLAPGSMPTALIRGDVDAFSWSTQAIGVARRQAPGKIAELKLDGIEKLFQSHQLLLTTERVVKEKPGIVTAAVKALLAAEQRIESDPGWPDLISARIKTSPADIREATSTFTFKLGFDERFVEDLVSQAEWAITTGLARRPPGDLRALLRPLVADGPLKALRPDRVTLA